LAVKVATDRLRPLGTVPTGREPAHVVVTPDNRTVYVTNGGDGTVTAIDAASRGGSPRSGSAPSRTG